MPLADRYPVGCVGVERRAGRCGESHQPCGNAGGIRERRHEIARLAGVVLLEPDRDVGVRAAGTGLIDLNLNVREGGARGACREVLRQDGGGTYSVGLTRVRDERRGLRLGRPNGCEQGRRQQGQRCSLPGRGSRSSFGVFAARVVPEPEAEGRTERRSGGNSSRRTAEAGNQRAGESRRKAGSALPRAARSLSGEYRRARAPEPGKERAAHGLSCALHPAQRQTDTPQYTL